MSTWLDLLAAGAVGAWFGFAAYVSRMRRENAQRLGWKCLIADMLVGSAAADLALLGCMAAGATVLTTALSVAIAGWSGQAAIDKLVSIRSAKPSAD